MFQSRSTLPSHGWYHPSLCKMHRIRDLREHQETIDSGAHLTTTFFFCAGHFNWQKCWFMSTFSRHMYLSSKCKNDGLPSTTKTLGGPAILPDKCFYRLPEDREKESVVILLFKQKSSHMKHIRHLLSCSIRTRTHFISNSSRQSHSLRFCNLEKQYKEVHK